MVFFLMIRRPPRSSRTDTLSLHDALPICTEGGELGFVRSFGHFILSLAWLLIGPTPAPNERGACGDSALARIHHNHIDLNAREIRLYGEDHDGRGICDVRTSGAPGPNRSPRGAARRRGPDRACGGALSRRGGTGRFAAQL